MKRRRADRPGWRRILERRFAQQYVDDEAFQGYVTLLALDRVTEPLWVNVGAQEVCVAADRFIWLQQFPSGLPYTVTTMFDREGNVVQWYIDICWEHGIDESGVPWFDDLYLDVVAVPSGQPWLLDEEDLRSALAAGIISSRQYDRAYAIAHEVMEKISSQRFPFFALSVNHRNALLPLIPPRHRKS